MGLFLKNRVVLVVVAGWGGSLLLAARDTVELENDRPADGNGHVEVDAWHDEMLRAVDRVAPYAERDSDDVDMIPSLRPVSASVVGVDGHGLGRKEG